ncbi:MAG: fatty acid desaturase [Hyphomicrobiaceae bacterium]
MRLARHCSGYREPSTQRALLQVATTVVPLIALVATMVYLAPNYPWLTLLLALPLGGLLVRCFIIQHDCGHGSFTASRRLNDFIGRCMSVLTVTPYGLWRRVHARHHATSGNLDKRGAGDIKTLTVAEYAKLTPVGKFNYKIYRNPLFLFLIGVPAFFLLIQRVPWFHPVAPREAWRSIIGLDLALVLVYLPLALLLGTGTMALIIIPSVVVASVAGGWLFFIQHQFEETHWSSGSDWDFQVASVMGSSFYDLPPVLNWFTGNIGLHHIHHLNSMIPNYRLQECLAASPELRSLNRLRFWESLKCYRLTLWDEEKHRLIRFRDFEMQHAAG